MKELNYIEKKTPEAAAALETETLNHNNEDPENTARENKKKEKRTRQRKIPWFNPPFSKNVATNIAKTFFTLINTCFPPDNKLHKIIMKIPLS
ncbi:hypothetical protein ElyMa_006304500 [Elysia marginata]|uniref:Uncharacterized protein n=1 Tax=Elysia marginata TaxID=1093978 RepID=A0AAV4HEV1_9GAST|nr:hypothetical protein ElyMa_006304500 [Elysia marginata]